MRPLNLIRGRFAGLESQQMRSELTDHGLVLFAVAVPFAMALSTVRSWEHGWSPIYSLHLVLTFMCIGGALLRKRLPYNIRALIIPLTFYIFGTAGFLTFGLVGGGGYALFIAPILLALAFGRKGALAGSAISGIILLITAWLTTSGRISYHFDLETYAHSTSAWGVLAVDFVIFLPMILLSLGIFQDHYAISLRQVRAQQGQLRTLIETLPDLVWLKDTDGVYLACNRKFERFFGASEEEIVGKTDYDFVSADLADLFREMDLRAIEKGSPSINEEEVVYADDGHKELLETIKTPVYDDEDRLIGVLGVARDITKRTTLEARMRQSQKLEALGTLVGGIAHDFNNILQSIFLYGEILDSKLPESGPARDSFTHIARDARRARELVGQILTFSRKGDFNLSAQRIQPVIEDGLAFLKASFPPSVNLVSSIDQDCPAVLCDKTQIHQILINICNNARHALVDSSGVITVTLQPDMEDELEQVKLVVEDTGRGMSPEVLEKVFDPFFTTKPAEQGTGLGLSVVHGLVQVMQGSIYVESEEGNGTRITIRFPVSGEVSQNPEPEIKPAASVGGTLLIVDDETSILRSLDLILTQHGFVVHTAENAQSALEQFFDNPAIFNFIITDLVMPGMSGFDLAKAVRRTGSRIPIILSSGEHGKDLVTEMEASGVNAHMLKPWNASDLLAVLARFHDDEKSFATPSDPQERR